MSESSQRNPLPRIVEKVFSLLFTALIIYGCWYTWQLYKVYEAGYTLGLQHGKYLRDIAAQKQLRAQGFNEAKKVFIATYGPKSEKTWKDSLYRQGWTMAVDKATEDVPR